MADDVKITEPGWYRMTWTAELNPDGLWVNVVTSVEQIPDPDNPQVKEG